MKIIPVLMLVLLSKSVFAQTDNTPYIFSGTYSIGVVKFLEFPNSKLFFHSHNEESDKTGVHKDEQRTEIGFTQDGVLIKRVFTVSSDHPINSFEIVTDNDISQVIITHNETKTEYKISVNELKGSGFSFIIYSNEQLLMKIYEVSKYIKFE